MKVGDYVRYKYENCIYMGKIKFISEAMGFEETLQFDIDNCIEEILKEDIIKSRPRIIDLIQAGDYVNSKQVIDFMLENGKRKGIIVDADIWGFDIDEIKSIVTKEQFEQMEYKVGE